MAAAGAGAVLAFAVALGTADLGDPASLRAVAALGGAAVYGARLCVHDAEQSVEERFGGLERVHGLGENAEVLCARAEHSYYQHDCRGAHAFGVYGADAPPSHVETRVGQP